MHLIEPFTVLLVSAWCAPGCDSPFGYLGLGTTWWALHICDDRRVLWLGLHLTP